VTNFWIGVNVTELCDQHLLGLHKELHQEKGTIDNHPHGQAIVRGHWKLGQASTEMIQQRHEEVVREMSRRGMNHDSPLQHCDGTGLLVDLLGMPVKQLNRVSLSSRCGDCNLENRYEGEKK